MNRLDDTHPKPSTLALAMIVTVYVVRHGPVDDHDHPDSELPVTVTGISEEALGQSKGGGDLGGNS